MSKRTIDHGLKELRQDLILMASHMEGAITTAIRAWKDRDVDAIFEVLETEKKVNAFHKEVDARCFELLATQTPLANDLRLILSISKINSDLERMVDLAVNIVKTAEYYIRCPSLPVAKSLEEMAEKVRFMVREAVDAFVKMDDVLSENVLMCDDKVDVLKDQILRDVILYSQTRPNEVEQGFNTVLIARNLERIADHCTNIAEDVIFSLTGKDVRHPLEKPEKPEKPGEKQRGNHDLKK